MEEKGFFIGDIKFDNPILNASGCWCMNEKQLDELYCSYLGGIVTKTCTIFSKEGNPEPNYYHCKKTDAHFNCKGLPNFGYDYYKKLSKKYTNKPYIISLAFENYDDLKVMLNDYEKYSDGKQLLVELNLSCPNFNALVLGYSHFEIEKLLGVLKMYNLKNIKFGLKLPPYLQVELIEIIANIINNFTDIVKYIVLSNSIPNCVPLEENGKKILSKQVGGMSGKINKYISLSNVMYFSKILSKEIVIVACGGIDSLEDIEDYLDNGASFVQLASCFYDSESNTLNKEKINKVVQEFILN
jgi:dihydroorotate dehydrogenase (fumarate)